ncbi:protein yellow [Coccinella septempunctata]|uniref:protein yellow n=1 Tax=Coccinella septempunctata TaxID=41139 RepID=UPI001D07C90D|nr:protein yellow [Coccinella septempunctata]
MLLRLTILAVTVFVASIDAAKLENVFEWNELSFNWPDEKTKEAAIKAGGYIPENNLPLGLDRWNDKLFVTVPRWKKGVAATLNYIDLKTSNKTPSLTPYPDWSSNTLPEGEDAQGETRIISTFRVNVDACDRLWVMDTGLADIWGEGKQHSTPAILIYDLKTDKLLKRYVLQPTDLKEDSFFANIIVDVNTDKCEDAFAYIPDLGGYGVVVYSLADNESWRIKHNFFYFDPLNGDFNVGGINFQWTDGVFGLALGRIQPNGYRTMFFHPLAGIREFSVSTEILRNKTLATSPDSYHAFKLEGNRGEKTQSSASDLDEQTNVLFLTQLNKDGVACWNVEKPLNPDNLGTVAQDSEGLIFTNDLKIDAERNLWILSDKMPTFLYKALQPNETNYRIFKVKIDEAIVGTPCAA